MKSFIWNNKNRLYTLLSTAILLIIWHMISLNVGNEFLFPTPLIVVNRVIEIVMGEGFIIIVLNTIKRSLLSFSLAFVIAVIAGILAGLFKPIFYLLKPVILLKKSMPTISIILLLLIWFREKAPIFIGFIVIFPIIYSNVVVGISNINKDLVEMATTYNISKMDMLKGIYIPSIVPYLLASASSAIGINLKVVIAAETWSNATNSIGDALLIEKIGVSIEGLLAWTIIAIIIAGIFDYIIGFIENKVVRWK